MSFCTFCGAQFQNLSSIYCSMCGARRTDIVASPPPLSYQESKFTTRTDTPSPRRKDVALWLAATLGPWAYVYIARTHKVKLIIGFIAMTLVGVPLLVQMFSDPKFQEIVFFAFSSSTSEPIPNSESFNIWQYYFSTLGFVTIGLSLILRVLVFIDINRLSDKFFKEYKD